jgi:ubiquinone/menaquinone biosynthesis C-methylase UbiE
MLGFDSVERYTSDPLYVLKNKELHSLLAKAVEELNPQQRRALLLKDAEENSYQDAARMMNLGSSAFTSLLNRARMKFAQLIVSSLSPNVRVHFGYKECLSLLQWFDPLDWPENLDLAITFKARQYFDSVAQEFNDRRPQRYPPVLDDILLARYQPNEDAIGGDFGSGFGHLSVKMAGRFSKVCSVDISPQMINVARKYFKIKGLRNIDPVIEDVSKLSLPNESLDMAYCVSVLHHVLDPGECIKEMARVLKKGGKLILADFEAHKYDHCQLEHKDLWLGFNKPQIAKWLKKANFEEIWVEDYSDISFSIDIKHGKIARVPLLLAGGTKV